MMRLLRFNAKGIEEFRKQLEAIRNGASLNAPLGIAEDPALTEPVPDGGEIEVRIFDRRHDMAACIDTVLSSADSNDDMSDTGLWAWLSAIYLDSVCPADSRGLRNPGNDYRHIPSVDWRHFYRHLVRGPVRIYRLFKEKPETAAIVLCQKPSSPGDFAEQLASRQERITNPAIIEAANRLYYDKEKQLPKRGAAPNWPKPGTLRRFGDLLNQLDLTYDLYSLSADDLLKILPREFAAYRD
jgi:hypothetical protein